MPKVMFLCGAPGSGKSTFARTFLIKHKDKRIAYISRDKIRYSLLGKNDEYFSKEDEVLEKFHLAINTETRKKRNDYVIIDATHLSPSSRRIPLANIDKECELMVMYFMPKMSTCIERNNQRTGRELVPEKQVKKMYNSFRFFSEREKSLFNKVSYWMCTEEGIKRWEEKI